MQKIKQFLESEQGKDFLIFIIFILVSFGSFYLGRLSKNESKDALQIEYVPLEANVLKSSQISQIKPQIAQNSPKEAQIAQSFLNQNPELNKSNIVINKQFFASSRGKKYYPIDCSAGKSIKLENRTYFASAKEAENRGYEQSSSCKY